jgi:hypothetical protein
VGNGWIKNVLGFPQFSVRGLQRVNVRLAGSLKVNKPLAMAFASRTVARSGTTTDR